MERTFPHLPTHMSCNDFLQGLLYFWVDHEYRKTVILKKLNFKIVSDLQNLVQIMQKVPICIAHSFILFVNIICGMLYFYN